MENSEIKHICKRVGKKEWDNLLPLWVNILPQIHFPLVSEPEPSTTIDKLKNIRAEIDRISNLSTNKNHYYVIEGIHTLIYQELIFLFYKGLNVLRSTQCELDGGFKTWSITNAYQSSYFLLRCLLNILGVHISKVDSWYLLIDLLPEYKELNVKAVRSRRIENECQVQIVHQLEHWELWTLLQRVLNVLRCPLVNDDVAALLVGISPKYYARQRNKLIYFNSSWLFPDLKKCIADPNFAIRKLDFDEDLVSEEDFTMIISYLLLKVCYDLLANIAAMSPRFQEEMQVINQIISQDDNSRYMRFLHLQEFIA